MNVGTRPLGQRGGERWERTIDADLHDAAPVAILGVDAGDYDVGLLAEGLDGGDGVAALDLALALVLIGIGEGAGGEGKNRDDLHFCVVGLLCAGLVGVRNNQVARVMQVLLLSR